MEDPVFTILSVLRASKIGTVDGAFYFYANNNKSLTSASLKDDICDSTNTAVKLCLDELETAKKSENAIIKSFLFHMLYNAAKESRLEKIISEAGDTLQKLVTSSRESLFTSYFLREIKLEPMDELRQKRLLQAKECENMLKMRAKIGPWLNNYAKKKKYKRFA